MSDLGLSQPAVKPIKSEEVYGCWDPDPSKTTTAEELYENFDGWHDKLLIITNNVNSISIDERIPTIYNW
ncbi:unnamed protein product [Rhizophagus irregularis]|nr:unnamed protein product [Rhizophagus irregularis]